MSKDLTFLTNIDQISSEPYKSVDFTVKERKPLKSPGKRGKSISIESYNPPMIAKILSRMDITTKLLDRRISRLDKQANTKHAKKL